MTRQSISFVLPMFNEASGIERTAKAVTTIARDLADDYEIIIVDDASTDSSGDIADSLSRADSHIKSIRLRKNTKFGGALKAGLMAAVKDLVLYTDADLPVKEEDAKEALKLIGPADVVTAYSLVIKDSSLKRIIISKGYNFLVRLLFGLDIRDINSGFKIYKKKVLEGMALKSMSPFIDAEIFCEAMKRGFKIEQYGLIFQLRTKGKSTISRFSVMARSFYDMFSYWLSQSR